MNKDIAEKNVNVKPTNFKDLLLWKGKIVLAHLAFFWMSLFMSFIVLNNMQINESWFGPVFWNTFMAVATIKLVIYGLFRQYQGWWRYVSVSDLFSIIKATHVSLVIEILGYYTCLALLPVALGALPDGKPILNEIPVSVFVADWVATICTVCGSRLLIRLYYEESQQVVAGRLTRMLIVGAGNAGETLLREIRRMPILKYEVVGFVDDNPRKLGMRIHGAEVIGTTKEIKKIAQEKAIDELVIAMPSASRKELRHVIAQCEGSNLKFSTVPDLVSIATGKVSVSKMREVDINDLLGRDPITLDIEQISKFLNNKVVMVTGAGGSIGSEMCRQICQFGPKKLLLVEQAENPLFHIERELQSAYPTVALRPIICDIADGKRVDKVFSEYHPEVVIHAAAHKHVPLMEANPGEAFKNNVCGTRNVALAADKYKAKNFVMISTDKAVNPTSIMGSSKRFAEMVIQGLNTHSDTDFITVRFGNVLGSNGSVVPIFTKQIMAGGPVTVTHPDMQRYFMTIPEASQLVLQAATMGKGGEVFLLDMGEPVKIADLARELITLSGYRPDEDIEIKYTGMRPGEKLFEELSIAGEDMKPTPHPKIAVWQNIPANEDELRDAIDEMLAIADNASYEQIVSIIKRIIPEYVGDVDSKKLHEEHLKNRTKISGQNI
ncbi:MAG: polysaccharide biosynthesis protein [Sedimentisphaerales bacterium]|nr:polysaccharide biosynthesis protein [Sedimentisphaerales bacterium]MBN2843015.1 polysaccharide biosynthesis protein [Sedimentisphaerales bacterium]